MKPTIAALKFLALLCLLAAGAARPAEDPAAPADFPAATSGGLSGGTSLGSSGIRSVLPADEAFALTALVEAPDTLVFMWEIREGYYLYRKSLSFQEVGTASVREPVLPQGEQTVDEFFGEVEVYYDRLIVEIPFSADEQDRPRIVEMTLTYQGCAEAGYCYPVQHKSVSLEVL